MSDHRENNFLTAALVGALVGAGVAILLNEDMRKKIGKQVGKTIKIGEEEAVRLKAEIKELKDDLQKKMAKELAMANK